MHVDEIAASVKRTTQKISYEPKFRTQIRGQEEEEEELKKIIDKFVAKITQNYSKENKVKNEKN